MHNLTPSTSKDTLLIPKPAHRLDNQTSGLLLIGKTRSAIKFLGEEFEAKRIKKEYCAVVSGKTNSEGSFNSSINQQSASTRYKRLAYYKSVRNGFISVLNLWPETGRTHQLRIHLANNNTPIIGDKLYGEKGNILFKKGLFLSAVKLTFTHPISKKTMELSIPYPKKFDSFILREERNYNANLR